MNFGGNKDLSYVILIEYRVEIYTAWFTLISEIHMT
jgi:hypothetical protein